MTKSRITFLLLIVFLSSACTTVKLGKGPDVFGLSQYENMPTIGVSKVTDGRQSKKAGTIGADTIMVKEGIGEMTTNYLIHGLKRMEPGTAGTG